MFKWKINVFRTRDPEVLATAQVVFDVGGVYDPETCRFDHHQRECEARWNGSSKLSSAGMVWLQYGLQLVREEAGDLDEVGRMAVWEEVYQTFIKHIDDLDNGVGDLTQGTLADAAFSSVIADFNVIGEGTEDDHYKAYMYAMEMSRGTVSRRICHAAHAVRQRIAIRERLGSEKVLVLDEAIDPVIVSQSSPDALLVVMPQYGQWMVVCVPPSRADRFSQRLPFPEGWKGLRGPNLAAVLADGPAKDEAIADESGAQTFVHNFRFCGGMRSREAAIDLANQVLKG